MGRTQHIMLFYPKNCRGHFFLPFLVCNLTFLFPQQPSETGLPYIQNYGPSDYRAFDQNRETVQDSEGVLYIAHGDGILSLNGASWKLSELLFELAEKHPELEAMTQNLSSTPFRYVPRENLPEENVERAEFLNTLNEMLLDKLQQGGEVFISNAIVKEHYCLRACIVNFRTSKKDFEEIIDIIVREGNKIYQKLLLEV